MRRASTARTARVLLTLFSGGEVLRSIVLVVTIFAPQLAALITAVAIRDLVDSALRHDNGGMLRAAIVAGITAGIGVLSWLINLDAQLSLMVRVRRYVDLRLMRTIGGADGIEHLERPDIADAITLARERSLEYPQALANIGNVVAVAVSAIGSLVLLARITPLMLLLPLFGAPALVLSRLNASIYTRAETAAAEPRRRSSHILEIVTSPAGARETRTFAVSEALVERHAAAYRALERVRNRASVRGQLIGFAQESFPILGFVGAIALVTVRAASGSASPGDVVLAVLLAQQALGVIGLAAHAGELRRLLGNAHRIADIEAHLQASRLNADETVTCPPRLNEGIVLDSVSFRYPGTERLVLDGVSLHLPAGRVVALVGENGSGKTTLVKLLARFYDASGGRILVDGTDLRLLDLDAWRARTVAGFQDFARFEMRLLQSVGVGELSRIDDRSRVATSLHDVSADDLAALHEDALDTQLGTAWEGIDLSGGQWQKVALARSGMRDLPLLALYDEPTASLDPLAEHELFERLTAQARNEGRDGVTVLVSHRFSTVRMADLIVVLDRGRVVEVGSHQELMGAGGLYAELFELQARVYR